MESSACEKSLRITEQARKLSVHLIGPTRPATVPQTPEPIAPPSSSGATSSDPATAMPGVQVSAQKSDFSASETSESSVATAAASMTHTPPSTLDCATTELNSVVTQNSMAASTTTDVERIKEKD